jgi:hypothetical protein
MNSSKTNLLQILLIVLFLSDVFNTFFKDSFSLSIVTRGGLYFIAFIYMIYNEKIQYILVYFILMLSLLVGYMTSMVFFNSAMDILLFIQYFFKYTFLYILYIFMIKYFKISEIDLKKILKVFIAIVTINVVSQIIGLVFSIPALLSYPDLERFGAKGLVPATNEVTLFYLIALMLGYYRFKYENNYKLLILAISGSLLTGTKGILIALILLLVILLLNSKRKLYSAISVFLIIGSTYLLILEYFSEISLLFKLLIYQYEKSGLLSMLLSGRNGLFIEHFLYAIDNVFNELNLIFGGIDISKYGTELDFIDAFSFFGIFGLIVYLLMYSIIFYKVKYALKMFIILYFILASFGGHFFGSPLNAIYVCVLILYILYLKHEKLIKRAI